MTKRAFSHELSVLALNSCWSSLPALHQFVYILPIGDMGEKTSGFPALTEMQHPASQRVESVIPACGILRSATARQRAKMPHFGDLLRRQRERNTYCGFQVPGGGSSRRILLEPMQNANRFENPSNEDPLRH